MPKKIDNNLIVGLDIGTSKVVAIVADILPDGNLEIIGVGSSLSTGLKKGVVVNIEATIKSIQKAIEEAELMAGCQIHSVYAGIAGSHIRSFNSHGVVAIQDSIVTKDDVKHVIDAAKAVAVPLDQKILHVLPQEFAVDNQTEILDPIGMSGVRLEANIHMVTGSVSAAQNIITCVRRCGLEVDDITLEQLASSYAVLTNDERQLGVCLVDIGGGTTDIAVFNSGTIEHTSVIPVAGDQATNDLSVAFRISKKNAEVLKIKHSCVMQSLSSNEYEIEIPNVIEEDAVVVTQTDLAKILEPRYEELFLLIKKDLEKNGLLEKLSSGIVLTGGSSKIQGAVELAHKIFNLPVRLGAPRNISGMEEVVKNPVFATGVGLLLSGKQSQTDSEEYNPKQKFSNFFGRVKNWFQGNF